MLKSVFKTIDRKKLAQIVFKNKTLLRELNRITHPKIIRTIKKEVKRIKRGLVVIDAPLLIEAGLANFVDKIIVVNIGKERQIERLLKKTSLSKAEILQRLKLQLPLRNKIRWADFVIDNNGTIDKTRRQVEKIRRRLWKN